ncbi:MAG: magnesium transporter MgtE N-terminal domain-containing protein, partial [Nitrospirota bacterium]
EGLLKVAKMYEAMPPEEAARKLEKLDEDVAVIILNSLKPKTAGKILAQMENDKAASLSKKILIKGKVLQEKTSQ